MTYSNFEESLLKGLDVIASENRLGNITTQLVSRYSGIPEAKMLRHISSLDVIVASWFQLKQRKLRVVIDGFNGVDSKEGYLQQMGNLLELPSLLTLLVAKNIDRMIDVDIIEDLRHSFRESLLQAIVHLKGTSDRSHEELAGEVMFTLSEVVSYGNKDSRRKIASLKKNLPWEIECDLFPSQEVIKRLAVSESGFIFDPVSGKSYSANSSAMSILKILQRTTDVGEITSIITDEYDVLSSMAERDILDFSVNLRGLFS